ncbi:tripartite tricarboxylate transporter substrate binding protein [Pseudorhodoferax sp. Leaf265]|uniref:Bug family tripartite tricarboxylate transporter substrate binding protein n=1 Tax=Pseudorhodoferax sp. Leaf265 TaxID=1736315 RepID=UPI0007002833|nr:tripartite tricarboxylate transporter substrate-binding protein [Pseudorhodoferax sp. Leaf265]KQP15278.1 hypothetical protein ASF45_29380 [Pseudorhodoferax sp. Leaf265]
MFNTSRRVLLQTALCTALPLALASHAAAWPTKPVTIVVPYPAGGSADAMVRPIAEKLSRLWGQPVVVDNRTGANGIIATQLVMRAEPDGHTVLLHLTGFIQNASLLLRRRRRAAWRGITASRRTSPRLMPRRKS